MDGPTLRNIPLAARGKVRDVYDLGSRLLMVASDRVSAFDVVMPTPVPDKGRLLNLLSLFWFARLAPIMANHVVGAALDGIDGLEADERAWLEGRAAVVRKAEVLPVECVARGYLAGSAWNDYCAAGAVSGIALPPGLPRAGRLPRPLFTPSTKAAPGHHDEPIDHGAVVDMVGEATAARLRDATLALYAAGAAHAATAGIILADTKFEFGLIDGELVLVDECLTSDSSRYWPAASYRPGSSPPSFDKQFLRDWLETVPGWNKTPPGPELPDDIVARTRARYVEAYERLTGRRFS